MNNKEISRIVLKIFSIYILVQTLLALPQFYSSYLAYTNIPSASNACNSIGDSIGSYTWLSVIGVISVICLFVISALIWRLSNKTSEQLSNINSGQSFNTNEGFIISILGLYLIFYGVQKFATISAHTHYLISFANEVTPKATLNFAYLSVYFLVVILGASLIAKASSWLTVLKKLRTMGAK